MFGNTGNRASTFAPDCWFTIIKAKEMYDIGLVNHLTIVLKLIAYIYTCAFVCYLFCIKCLFLLVFCRVLANNIIRTIDKEAFVGLDTLLRL